MYEGHPNGTSKSSRGGGFADPIEDVCGGGGGGGGEASLGGRGRGGGRGGIGVKVGSHKSVKRVAKVGKMVKGGQEEAPDGGPEDRGKLYRDVGGGEQKLRGEGHPGVRQSLR